MNTLARIVEWLWHVEERLHDSWCPCVQNGLREPTPEEVAAIPPQKKVTGS